MMLASSRLVSSYLDTAIDRIHDIESFARHRGIKPPFVVAQISVSHSHITNGAIIDAIREIFVGWLATPSPGHLVLDMLLLLLLGKLRLTRRSLVMMRTGRHHGTCSMAVVNGLSVYEVVARQEATM